MSEEGKRIIEINGIKMEVDLREAKRIDTFRVGDTVKVLMKKYGGGYNVYPGVIVSFVEFAKLPTIEVLYLEYSKVSFAAINSETEEIEIAPASEIDTSLSKAAIEDTLSQAVNSAQKSLDEAKARIRLFREYFGKHFNKGETE